MIVEAEGDRERFRGTLGIISSDSISTLCQVTKSFNAIHHQDNISSTTHGSSTAPTPSFISASGPVPFPVANAPASACENRPPKSNDGAKDVIICA